MIVEAARQIETFRCRLGDPGVLTSAADMEPYERSARHACGRAVAVLRPGSEAELAWTVKTLSELKLPLVVQGAATGLVGAATPTPDGRQWVLSTQRVRNVLEVDPVNRCVKVSAGFRLSDVNRVAAAHGLVLPIDLGADPTIGGMIATNTGGARLIRYGGVRENLMDVSAVLMHPAGECVGSAKGLRKDNTGLSWTQLLCGTFGAFGVISRATLKLHPVQQQSATALIALSDVHAAIGLMCELEREFGEMVSAFEGISGAALEAVAHHQRNVPVPFATMPAYAILVEVSSAIRSGQGLDLEAMLMNWLEKRMVAGELADAIVDKPAQLWRIRHSISESVQACGRLVAFDLAVSRSRFAEFRKAAVCVVQDLIHSAQICDFGHLGDGGIHLNLVVPHDLDAATVELLRDTVYDLAVLRFEGSYSAEHGVGPYNASFYERFTSPLTRELSGVLKKFLDPGRALGNAQLS